MSESKYTIKKKCIVVLGEKYEYSGIEAKLRKHNISDTRIPVVRKISAQYFRKVREKPKDEIFQLCKDLLKSGNWMERVVAFDWAFRLRRKYEKTDYSLFESWLKKHVDDWGSCDDFCTHAFGAFIHQFPEFLPKLKEWAKSTNRWVRRASAVVLIYSTRRMKHLETVFDMADNLLLDQDVMVQKGYGWMLKEASNRYLKEVLNYVMEHKKEMPRTSLRYAIEKLPPEQKKEAMKR